MSRDLYTKLFRHGHKLEYIVPILYLYQIPYVEEQGRVYLPTIVLYTDRKTPNPRKSFKVPFPSNFHISKIRIKNAMNNMQLLFGACSWHKL